ncbi:hypothetical protein [Georgenia sunbinii]|uniref:hypothetical protein n=1 Tax=Georgenia sunbinii TaxID=3117728 RepID=UPI002F261A46
MTHLGSRVTALVDGQLPAEEAEESLAHTVTCYECAELLRRERSSRRVLWQAGDIVPDDDLTARLLAIQHPGGHGAPRRRASRPMLVGIGAAAAFGVVAAGLPVLGALSEDRTDPQDILAAVEGRTGTTPEGLPSGMADGSSTAEVVGWLADHGWSVPDPLPGGMRVVDVEVFESDTGEVLEVELAGETSSIRLLQQHGRLAADDAAVTRLDDGGRWRLGTGGQHVVLQSGDRVVVVTPAVNVNGAGAQVLEVMPAGEYDTSVLGRFGRGWQAVASWATD